MSKKSKNVVAVARIGLERRTNKLAANLEILRKQHLLHKENAERIQLEPDSNRSLMHELHLSAIIQSKNLRAFHALSQAFPEIIKNLFGLDEVFCASLLKMSKDEIINTKGFLFFAVNQYLTNNETESLFHLAAAFGANGVLNSLMISRQNDISILDSNGRSFIYILKLCQYNLLIEQMLSRYPELDALNEETPDAASIISTSRTEEAKLAQLNQPLSPNTHFNEGIAYYIRYVFSPDTYNDAKLAKKASHCLTQSQHQFMCYFLTLQEGENDSLMQSNPDRTTVTCMNYLLKIYQASRSADNMENPESDFLLNFIKNICINYPCLQQDFIIFFIDEFHKTLDDFYLEEAYQTVISSNSLPIHLVLAVYMVKNDTRVLYDAIHDKIGDVKSLCSLEDLDLSKGSGDLRLEFNATIELIGLEQNEHLKSKLTAAVFLLKGLAIQQTSPQKAISFFNDVIAPSNKVKTAPKLLVDAYRLKGLALKNTDPNKSIDTFAKAICVINRNPYISLKTKLEILLLQSLSTYQNNDAANALHILNIAFGNIMKFPDIQALYDAATSQHADCADCNRDLTNLRSHLSQWNIFEEFCQIIYRKFWCHLKLEDRALASEQIKALDHYFNDPNSMHMLLLQHVLNNNSEALATFQRINPELLSDTLQTIYQRINEAFIEHNSRMRDESETRVQELEYKLFIQYAQTLLEYGANNFYSWFSALKEHHKIFSAQPSCLHNPKFINQLLDQYASILERHSDNSHSLIEWRHTPESLSKLPDDLLTKTLPSISSSFHSEILKKPSDYLIRNLPLNLLQIVFGIEAVFLEKYEYARSCFKKFESNANLILLEICRQIDQDFWEYTCDDISRNAEGLYTDLLNQLLAQPLSDDQEEKIPPALQVSNATPPTDHIAFDDIIEYFEYVLNQLLMPDGHDISFKQSVDYAVSIDIAPLLESTLEIEAISPHENTSCSDFLLSGNTEPWYE
ncbi:MAG: hypothetical protein COA94_07495 [Rickettsiales bacterium]|nr:MAG: hypothetical protein COA94_07495 [Rickettsiales bacterium]